ncbi:O-antigen ligase family protein [Maribacter sp. X9]|uniref:O-antigen ligase family protein n=1 Tax=Maribacter sp. X9 TaxID=3402159 RepID=UPI003AF349DC
MIITYFLKFEYLGDSVLKTPYVLSISRYFEIIACLVLCQITYSFFKTSKIEFRVYLKWFIDLNILITIFFVIIYFSVYFGLISIDSTRIVYSDFRLRGYYVEGGPYGLMLSFIFITTSLLKYDKSTKYRRVLLLIVILFLAKSKSGLLCTVLWLGIENYVYLKRKIKQFVYPILIIGITAFTFFFINISEMYVKQLTIVKSSVEERPTDTNLIMGRIPSVFIVPEIINDHSFFGIGIGNYPLLRNNREYRGFFPLPPKEFRVLDSHSLGGIFDILIDTGIIGLFFFSLILINIWKSLKALKFQKRLLIGFLMLFLFGVQIYFLYPWILLGILISLNENRSI